MNFKIIVFTAMAALSTTAWAQTTVPNTFSANTPASAAEVNANFSALVTAINSLDGRVTALEESSALTMNNIAGTWLVYGLEIEAGARDDSDSGVSGGYLIQSTVFLDSNGTFTITDADDGVRVFTSVFKGDPNSGFVTDVQIDDIVESSVDGDSGTWTLNSNTVTLTFAGGIDTQDVLIAPGGGMLVTSFAEDDSFVDNGSTMRTRILSLTVGVKTADQAP